MLEKLLFAIALLATVLAALAVIGGADPAALGGFAVAAIGAVSAAAWLRERR